MQELLHRLRRRALFFRVPPRMPARSAAASIQTAGVSICACVFPKAVSRARKQTAKQQPATASAAGSRFPAVCFAARKLPRKTAAKQMQQAAAGICFDRPHRRARVLPPAQTGPEALRRRWQGIAELFAGNFRSRILFSCVLPSSAKGYVCPDRKRTG